MKKIALLLSLILLGWHVSVAQETSQKTLSKSIIFSVGLGAGYSCPIGYLDLAPETGIQYRLTTKNRLGLTLQGFLPIYEAKSMTPHRNSYLMMNLFLSHTYDVSDCPRALYLTQEAGLCDITSNPGPHAGAELGYRILLPRNVFIRFGASVDWNRMRYGEGWADTFVPGFVVRLEL